MMTDHDPEYALKSQDVKTGKRHLFYKIFIAMMLASFFQNEVGATEKLREGTWKGTFLTHDGTLYRIKYLVSYDDESQHAPLEIKMINLDLEPMSEFTYALSDIEIKNKQLLFKIPKEFETKLCTLKKKNGTYSGTCISTAGTADEVSEITMVPPAMEPPDAQ
jgi:hypothetical protein